MVTVPATVVAPGTSTPSHIILILEEDKASMAVKLTGAAYAAPVAPLAGLMTGTAASVGAVVSVAPGVLAVDPPPPPPHAAKNMGMAATRQCATIETWKRLFLFDFIIYLDG